MSKSQKVIISKCQNVKNVKNDEKVKIIESDRRNLQLLQQKLSNIEAVTQQRTKEEIQYLSSSTAEEAIKIRKDLERERMEHVDTQRELSLKKKELAHMGNIERQIAKLKKEKKQMEEYYEKKLGEQKRHIQTIDMEMTALIRTNTRIKHEYEELNQHCEKAKDELQKLEKM